MIWSLLRGEAGSPYIQQGVAVVQAVAYEGVYPSIVSAASLVSILRICIDIADVHVRGTADLVDVCLHPQPVAPQHYQVACDWSDRVVGSRNAERSSKDVVLRGELGNDVFFLDL